MGSCLCYDIGVVDFLCFDKFDFLICFWDVFKERGKLITHAIFIYMSQKIIYITRIRLYVFLNITISMIPNNWYKKVVWWHNIRVWYFEISNPKIVNIIDMLTSLLYCFGYHWFIICLSCIMPWNSNIKQFIIYTYIIDNIIHDFRYVAYHI